MGRKLKSPLIKPGEAAAVGLSAIMLGVLCDGLNAFDHMAAFIRAHDGWELDEWLFVLLFAGIGASVIAIRRGRDLAAEIEQRERAEARANRLARHDPLTGLANRRVLRDELPALLRAADAAGLECSVFGIDLDHFKPINDAHGHEMGDRVLVEVADRLARTCPDALVARIGGDEFVVVAALEPGTDAPARIAAQIIRAVSTPYPIGERKLELGATVGIAQASLVRDAGGGAGDSDALIRAADVAMYEGKRAGRNTYRFFAAEMDERLRGRAMLEGELRDAIEAGQIVPHFQPVIALESGAILGFEALARWQHPERGMIPPDEFIPLAEDLGLIEAMSSSILRASCIAARDWEPHTTLAINISPVQLRDPWLPSRLIAILIETGMAPQRLIVEVTENAIIDDIDLAAEVFASLQRSGIRIALDDFGKGYSSLSHLRQLRFNHLKIDGSFVRSMGSPESRKIVQAGAGLGKALGMPVTAEGVEDEDTAQALRSIGCEQAQGYHFGRPASAEATAALSRSHGAGHEAPHDGTQRDIRAAG